MKLKLNLSMYPHDLKYMTPEQLKDPEAIIKLCVFSIAPPYEGSERFTVGEIEVDVDFELASPDKIIGAAAVALRQKAAGIRAKAHMAAGQVDEMANQLLAIEHTS